jgi:hypothetical protein
MTAQAAIAGPGDVIPQVAQAAYGPYEVHQLPNGGAGFINSGAGTILGQGMSLEMLGAIVLPKAAGIALLDGGKAFWNVADQEVTYLQTSAGDFLLGSIVGDARATDGECTVNFNVFPVYTFDLLRDPRTVAPVLTAGSPSFDLNRDGLLLLDATNEAQKIDLLGVDGFATGNKGIVELAFAVIADDSGTAAVFSIGAASGTNATAFTSIADSIGVQCKAHDGKIYAESKTGSVTVAPTDTTLTYTVGTRVEVWIDMRNPALCAIYVNGVRVLTSTVFDVSASAVNWYLLAHLVKTATTDTMKVRLDWLRQRQMTQ